MNEYGFNFNKLALEREKVVEVKKTSITSANMNRKEGQLVAEKSEENELHTVYNYMLAHPNAELDCHSINEILKKGTNIASRIFRKMEAAGYIEYTSSYTSNGQTVKTMHYKIKDPSVRELDLQKVAVSLKKIEEKADILKQLSDITVALLTKEFDDRERRSIAAMLMLVIKNTKNNCTESNINNFFNRDNVENLTTEQALRVIKVLTQR